MERMGLVSRVAEDLERVISQGRLPKDGRLPSEQLLSRQYGVSRTTVREALSHLAARGLIVQYPGRRSRAVPLDETVTLENLGVALHGEGPARPERRRLLEGVLALKRELTVELLAACCEQASKAELDRLADACLELRDAARWDEERGRWVAWEFELLRRAAIVADRPGHLMLIHSMERSFWRIRGRVLPHLDSASVCRWAECALYALVEKDAQALRRDLLPLLTASDERLFDNGTPVEEKGDTPAVSTAEALPSEILTSDMPTSEELASEVLASGERTSEVLASGERTSEVPTFGGLPAAAATSEALAPEAAISAAATSETLTPAHPTSAVEPPWENTLPPAVAAGEALAGAVLPIWSACRTGLCEARPAGGSSPASAPTGPRLPPGRALPGMHGTSDQGAREPHSPLPSLGVEPPCVSPRGVPCELAAPSLPPPLAPSLGVEPPCVSSPGVPCEVAAPPLPLAESGGAGPPEHE